ncbi:hypothetical protein [Bauldia litoralis]|nr:hypothetical protein [Bauldia litoralis]
MDKATTIADAPQNKPAAPRRLSDERNMFSLLLDWLLDGSG